MKNYFRSLVWLITITIAFSLACQPQSSTATKLAEPNATTKIETTQPAPAETPIQAEAVEPNEPTAAKAEAAKPAELNEATTEPAKPVAELEAGDTVFATVNGANITRSQIEEKIKPQMDQLKAQSSRMPEPFIKQYKDQIRKQALENAVIETLLDEQVKQAGITVTEDEITEYIEKMASQQGMSMDDLKALLQAKGQSIDDVKKHIRKGLPYQKLFETKLVDQAKITDSNAIQFYSENKKRFEVPEQIRASHILIKFDTADPNIDPNESKAKTRAKAEDLLKQIKDGADFAELAKANSADTGSAAKGGDLDFFSRGRMVPPFEEAAFALKPGQVSDVVETQYGFHIIKVIDHKDPNTIPFEQAKENIIKMLAQRKQGELAQQYIDSLKAKASIVYSDTNSVPKEPNSAPSVTTEK